MLNLSQENFDRAEHISDILHSIHGLEIALENSLSPILGKIMPEEECIIYAIIQSIAIWRKRATEISNDIARSGAMKQ